MPPSNTHGDLVVRLLSGESEQYELVLEAGRPLPPIALGTHGAWVVHGRQVARVHVMLAWSGETLFAGSPGGEAALLDGFALGARWTEVRAPSELRFGSARLSIGRRAGPDEVTEVPPEEATHYTGGPAGMVLPAVRRVWTDDQVTSMDDGRLQAALKLTRDDEVTCIAEVDVPPEAKRPGPVVLDSDAPISTMPPTIPSDGLIAVPLRGFERPLPVAVARPSQPTMAIPEPHGSRTMDSLGAGALAISGEHPSDASMARAPAPAPPVVWRNQVSALELAWRQASWPKKAMAVLMVPALLVALLMVRATLPARAHTPARADSVSAVGAAASSAPVTRSTAVEPPPSGTIPRAAPAPSSAAPVKAGALGVGDARTAERRALDAAASGQDAVAAAQYDALAAAHPETVAFREAARILRDRATIRHD